MRVKLINDLVFIDYDISLEKGDVVNIVKSQYSAEFIATHNDMTICSLFELIAGDYIKQTKSLNKFLPKGCHV